MPPHPAAGATDFAKFAPPMHGYHEKPACEPGELGSLWSVRRDCFSHNMSAWLTKSAHPAVVLCEEERKHYSDRQHCSSLKKFRMIYCFNPYRCGSWAFQLTWALILLVALVCWFFSFCFSCCSSSLGGKKIHYHTINNCSSNFLGQLVCQTTNLFICSSFLQTLQTF